MNYLIREHKTYMVRMRIPKDLQSVFGKTTFCKSLKTTDERLAKRLAPPLIANWKMMIDNARGEDTTSQGLVVDALRKEWQHATDTQREAVEMYAIEHRSPEEFKVITGHLRPLKPMIDSFIQSKVEEQVTKATLELLKGRLRLLRHTFTHVEDITLESVREFLGGLRGTTGKPLALDTKRKYLSAIIKLLDYHAIDTRHLEKIQLKVARKAAAKVDKRRSCTPEEFFSILENTPRKVYRDVIELSAYSGLRLEEAAQLKSSEVSLKDRTIKISDGKTQSSNRVVPMNSKVYDLLKDRVESEDVFPELKANKKTGRKGAVVSQSFKRAKRKLGMPETVVFHSLRKMFITKLHEERVAVDVIKKLVGHADQDITTGLYSDASLWPEMVEAVKKVSYPL